MNENEEILSVLEKFLEAAYDVQRELEIEMTMVENPKIKTNISKRKVRARMRLINNIIYSGEKVKERLEADKNNVLRRRRQK